MADPLDVNDRLVSMRNLEEINSQNTSNPVQHRCTHGISDCLISPEDVETVIRFPLETLHGAVALAPCCNDFKAPSLLLIALEDGMVGVPSSFGRDTCDHELFVAFSVFPSRKSRQEWEA